MRRLLESLIFVIFILGCFSIVWLTLLRMPECDYYSYKWNIQGGLAEPLGEAIRRAYDCWRANGTRITAVVKIPDIGVEKTVRLFVLSKRAENYICVLVTMKNCRIFEESGIGHIRVRIEEEAFSRGVKVSILRDGTVILSPQD